MCIITNKLKKSYATILKILSICKDVFSFSSQQDLLTSMLIAAQSYCSRLWHVDIAPVFLSTIINAAMSWTF